MEIQKRRLHIENLDLKQLIISSQCSVCGQQFNGESSLGERFDNLISRIRTAFDAHACESFEKAVFVA
jgi:hypothetical protein